MHYRCFQISYPFFLYPIPSIQQRGMTPASVVLSIKWRARRGLSLFLRSRCALYTYCGASLHLTIRRASRRVSYEQQHTAKKFPLLRSDVYTIEGKNPSEILLVMGSCRLQTFARSLGAQSAISIPAGTERRGRPLRCMYIYLSKYLYDTVAINVLYAYEAQNFAPWLRSRMRPLPPVHSKH